MTKLDVWYFVKPYLIDVEDTEKQRIFMRIVFDA